MAAYVNKACVKCYYNQILTPFKGLDVPTRIARKIKNAVYRLQISVLKGYYDENRIFHI